MNSVGPRSYRKYRKVQKLPGMASDPDFTSTFEIAQPIGMKS
jgi:hypothetical protein